MFVSSYASMRLRMKPRASTALRPAWLFCKPSSSSCAPFSSSEDDLQPPAHVPVMLQEVITAMSRNITDVSKPRYFVDGTAGFGGHSTAILQHFSGSKLLCIDRDPEVLRIAQTNLIDFQDRVSFQTGSYANMAQHLKASSFPNQVDGIVLDLGANSYHFDAAKRGFSVLNDGPLDMRFDQQDASLSTAADAVNTLSEVQLTRIFRDYGEERLAKEFAKAIVREREERGKVFQTTKDLRECIERIANMWKSAEKQKRMGKRANKMKNIHPATRCFQALRLYVNDELYHVTTGVKQLVNHLALNGRLVTIAFHSLEDRPIKYLFRELDRKGRTDDDSLEDFDSDSEDDNVDIDPQSDKHFRLNRRKATKASTEEIAMNSRSRSARLRCIERIL